MKKLSFTKTEVNETTAYQYFLVSARYYLFEVMGAILVPVVLDVQVWNMRAARWVGLWEEGSAGENKGSLAFCGQNR